MWQADFQGKKVKLFSRPQLLPPHKVGCRQEKTQGVQEPNCTGMRKMMMASFELVPALQLRNRVRLVDSSHWFGQAVTAFMHVVNAFSVSCLLSCHRGILLLANGEAAIRSGGNVLQRKGNNVPVLSCSCSGSYGPPNSIKSWQCAWAATPLTALPVRPDHLTMQPCSCSFLTGEPKQHGR